MAAAEIDDPRVYLAAERNLLAWVRTGLALMGFGFVVARFGLFLHEVAALATLAPAPGSPGFSLWIGTLLIGLGVAVTLLAALRHLAMVRSFERGAADAARRSGLAVAVAFGLAAIGLALAVYLYVSAAGLSPATTHRLLERGAPLVGQREDVRRLVVGDQPVADQALHELRERLVAGLVEHQAVGVQLAHRDRAAFLGDELHQPLAGRGGVGRHVSSLLPQWIKHPPRRDAMRPRLRAARAPARIAR
jgi:putative membrane protein